MPVYINGKSLDELFGQFDIKINEMEDLIDMKVSPNIKSVDELDFKQTLFTLDINYTHHESIEEWIRDLLKYE